MISEHSFKIKLFGVHQLCEGSSGVLLSLRQ